MPRVFFGKIYDSMLSHVGLALLGIALLLNAAALLLVNDRVNALSEARDWYIHSRSTLKAMRVFNLLLSEAESSQRGFLYTDNKDYLKPFNDNERKIGAQLAELRVLVTDKPLQQKLVDRIRLLTQEKLREMNKTVAMQQMGQKDAARDVVMTDQGKQLMNDLDQEIDLFISREDALSVELQTRWEQALLAIRWSFVVILSVNALLLMAGLITIKRDIARKRAALVQLDERAAVLASEIAQRAEELRALTAYLQRVQEEERRNVARELHDELGGTLSAVKMDIIMGRDAAAKRDDEKSVARLARAHTSIDSAIQFTRRLIENLRPTLLDNLGFEAALRSMTEQFCERTGNTCEISLPDGELALTAAQSTALYRICQEALTNVMKYANAKRVTVKLARDRELWTMILADDGVGIDATKQHRSISHGLIGMRERLVALGGTFDIRGKSGEGTMLTATFPVADATPAPG